MVVYKREFYANLLVVNTHEFNMILGTDWLSIFYAVINDWKRSIDFRIPNHSKFEFIGGSGLMEPGEFKACPIEGLLAVSDAILVEILVMV